MDLQYQAPTQDMYIYTYQELSATSFKRIS